MEVADEVVERGDGAVDVEGVALVRDGDEEGAAGAEGAEEVGEGAEGVLAVLEEVVGDDEVLGGVGLGLEAFAVVEDVDLDEVEVREFGVVAAEFGDGHAVDVADAGVAGEAEGLVEGADLDAGAAEEGCGEGLAVDRPAAEEGVAGVAEPACEVRAEAGHRGGEREGMTAG